MKKIAKTVSKDGRKKNSSDSTGVAPRRSIRPGYEHLAGLHSNSYPKDVIPDTDPERFDRSLESLVNCS